MNKLAEIMNRKEVRAAGSRRGNDTDVRRKEKENRKLQLELRSEKEKLNSTIIKYQREINDMQAVSPTITQTNTNHHTTTCTALSLITRGRLTTCRWSVTPREFNKVNRGLKLTIYRHFKCMFPFPLFVSNSK